MFVAASRHFAKSVGPKTLHPSLDLNSAERFKPLCLVKERKSIWPWKKPKMIPTLVTLNDVLYKKIENVTDFISSYTILENYKENPQFKLDGDIGSKIATELSIDISTVDTFEAQVSFGDIVKTEVKWENLEEKLSTDLFNLNHQLWLEVSRQKRTNICVVIESLTNETDGSLDSNVDEKASAAASTNIPKVGSVVTVDVHTKGDAEKKKHMSYNIPPNTVLAFGCTRLAVQDGGKMRLQVGLDKVDAAPLDIEEELTMPTDIDVVAVQELAAFKEANMKSGLQKAFKQCLANFDAFTGLFEVLSIAETTSADNYKFSKQLSQLRAEIGDGEAYWMSILEIIGFSFTDETKVAYPLDDSSGLIKASVVIVEAVTDLTPEICGSLKTIDIAQGKIVLSVLKSAIEGQMIIQDAGLANSKSPALTLLRNAGFRVIEADGVKKFDASSCASDEILRSLYVAVYALIVA